jgi:hypothetical protein
MGLAGRVVEQILGREYGISGAGPSSNDLWLSARN